jgi:uncharacterized membrane protein
MAEMILGIFNNRENVDQAINELQDLGFSPKDISIVMKDTGEAREVSKDTGASVASGTASGATAGGVLGALAGLLIGVGAIAVPGIGGLLIGGPLAAALGLTGAAATTATGALTGALAGGVVGALTSLGVSETEARMYETRIKEGAILVAIPVNAGTNQTQQVMDVLRNNNAEQINQVNLNA